MANYHFDDLKRTCYVYIVLCKDRTRYTGFTHNLSQRMTQHRNGEGSAEYVKKHGFGKLVYFEPCKDKTTAENREREIKDKGVKYRLALIANFQNNIKLLNKEEIEK